MDRKVLLAISGTMLVWGGLSCWVIKKQDDRYSKLMAQTNRIVNIVERLALSADPELVKQIKAELDFDWVVKDLTS